MKKLYVPIVVIVLLAGAAYFILQKNNTSSVSTESQKMEDAGMSEGVVTYTDSGFSPNTITVKQGETVRFVNQSNDQMWVASSVHPTHQDYPGFDQLKGVGKGEEYMFTFDKVGAWKYHNHLDASKIGTVVVQ